MEKNSTKEVRKNISKLVEKYNKFQAENKLKGLNEAQTINQFIEPLFSYLGWDIHNILNENEVTPEETISKGRVDRAFRINGIPKFFLEAKSIKADLDIESYARQAINYSWNKGVAYAVLTDFESIKVFNAQAQSRLLSDKLIFEIQYSDYLSDFERLWLLSKKSFEKNALDRYAEKYGKKIKKQTVNEKLFEDMKKARQILTESFRRWNKKVDQETLDEGVQRILDRLIFIRVLEDRKLEPPMLKEIVHGWEKDRSNNKQLFPMLTSKFRELDKIYNSNLFVEHSCEKWEEYDEAVKKVILMFYGTDVYEYDFKQIPADILGGVYENYLGYIAQNPIKMEVKGGKLFEAEGKKETKEKSRKKRKEQGIYYTPKFIVDYIVKNTLGKKLKEIKGMNDLKNIKVLDPACGSGSFLTRALEEINDKHKDFGYEGDQYTKTGIIQSNIYGVDLDPQAAELAKLNLLLDTLERKEKLPNIENIKVGNSLISGSEKELKKYFGKNWRDKKPFNWEEEFPEVFKQGGFDVIIGNPPWVTLLQDEIGKEELKYFKDNYIAAGGFKLNLFPMFVEKALKLLKDNGVMSFIIPNRLLDTPSYKFLMKDIIDNFRINFIVDIPGGSFENVVAGNIIICIQKSKPQDIIKIYKSIFKGDDQKEITELKTIKIREAGYIINLSFNENLSNIFSKINQLSEPLKNFANIHVGMMIKNKKEKLSLKDFDNSSKIVVGRDFDKFVKLQNRFFNPDEIEIFGGTKNKEKHKTKLKLLVRKTGNRLVAILDNEGIFAEQSVYLVLPKNINPKFLLSLLNSKLLTFYFQKNLITNPEAYPYIQHYDLEKIPIYKIDFSNKAEKQKHDGLAKLAEKMIKLQKQLQTIPENSDKWNSIRAEIEKTDKEIDRKVYELYGLTEEEIKIVENKYQ